MAKNSARDEQTHVRDDPKARILAAATELLAQGGRDALTTRAVAAVAGVQGPTIYRLFGDKGGLLEALAEDGFRRYFQDKRTKVPHADPVEDLRQGWDLHVAFGLAHPDVYRLMYGDPRPGAPSAAAQASYRKLEEHVRRIAMAGRLRVDAPRAASLIHAAGSGTVLSLLATPVAERDPLLSDTAREAVIAAISTESPGVKSQGFATAASALRASLSNEIPLTEGERGLLDEWLERLARG